MHAPKIQLPAVAVIAADSAVAAGRRAPIGQPDLGSSGRVTNDVDFHTAAGAGHSAGSAPAFAVAVAAIDLVAAAAAAVSRRASSGSQDPGCSTCGAQQKWSLTSPRCGPARKERAGLRRRRRRRRCRRRNRRHRCRRRHPHRHVSPGHSPGLVVNRTRSKDQVELGQSHVPTSTERLEGLGVHNWIGYFVYKRASPFPPFAGHACC